MDGPDIDVIAISGLSLTETEKERLWAETSPLELLRDCPSVEESEVGEVDEMPGQSDVFYEFHVRSKQVLESELRCAILARLKPPQQ